MSMPIEDCEPSSPTSPSYCAETCSALDLVFAPNCVIVDVRPQANFDQGHFNGAISLSFPAILWRRILKQKLRRGCLDEFLMCDWQELKRRHEPGVSIVLYDESTVDINLAPMSSPLRVLCEMLLLEKDMGTVMFYVKGNKRKISCATLK